MATYKIFRKGNYLQIINSENILYSTLCKNVEIVKNYLGESIYTIKNVNPFSKYNIVILSELLKEDGSNYTLNEWETFYTENTGNFNGGGTAPAFANITGQPSDNTNLKNNLDSKVDKTTTVNGKALSSNITINKADLLLENADNTSDVNKPISTAQQTALNTKANLTGGNTFIGTQAFSSPISISQFTTGTEPVYFKGGQYFNTTNNKMKIGGATAWETVTSTAI